MNGVLMTSIARILGFARPASDEACIEHRRAIARARARALVQAIAERQPDRHRR